MNNITELNELCRGEISLWWNQWFPKEYEQKLKT